MATKPKTEVAVKQDTPVGFSMDVPEHLRERTGPARGSEEVARDDMVIPRLEIVQASSPIKETNPREIIDGMMFNSASEEIYSDEVFVVPVYFRKEWLVWKDKDEGGGFHGSFATEAEALAKKAELIDEDPDLDGDTKKGRPILEVVDTPVHYCLLVSPTDPTLCQQIAVSMAKTKAKVSRKWNSMVEMFGGDRFSRVYKLTTFTDENKNGDKFKNFVVQSAGYTPEHLFRRAESLYELIKKGGIRAGHDQTVDNEAGAVVRGEI